MKSERVLLSLLVGLLGLALFLQFRRQAALELRLERLDLRVEGLAQADLERERNRISGEAAQVEREGRVYFPEFAFDADPARDATLADLFSRPLRAADLPSFWTRTRKGPDASSNYMQDPQFRLVRLDPGGLKDYVEVYREVGSPSAPTPKGFPLVAQLRRATGPPGMSIPFQFTAEQEGQFLQLLKDLDFWAMPTLSGAGAGSNSAAKGDRTLLEGFDGGKYRAVIRGGDASAAWAELCGLVRKVAGNAR